MKDNWTILNKIKNKFPNLNKFWIQNERGSGICEWMIEGNNFIFNQFNDLFIINGNYTTEENFIKELEINLISTQKKQDNYKIAEKYFHIDNGGITCSVDKFGGITFDFGFYGYANTTILINANTNLEGKEGFNIDKLIEFLQEAKLKLKNLS